MPLIVEDGTGVMGANSYATLDVISAYLASHGLIDPVPTEEAVLRAMGFLEGVYAGRWRGVKAHPFAVNALAWPRHRAYDDEGRLIASGSSIPLPLQQALAEAAYREIKEPGVLQPDLDRAGGVSSEMVKVGPITTQTNFAGGGSARALFTAIKDRLRPLLMSRGSRPNMRG